MEFLLYLLLFFLLNSRLINAQGPPSPGYYPSSRAQSIGFNQGFRNLWGPQHQSLDQSTLTIWLDKNSGLTSSLSFFIFLEVRLTSLKIYRYALRHYYHGYYQPEPYVVACLEFSKELMCIH